MSEPDWQKSAIGTLAVRLHRSEWFIELHGYEATKLGKLV
jgi:hypothetical protein